MDPLNTSNYVSIVICLLCAVMNFIRLIPFISQHTVDMEEEVLTNSSI